MATAKKKTTAKTRKTLATSVINAPESMIETARNGATDQKILSLVQWNKWLGFAYGAQALVLLFLSSSHMLPVQVQYLANDALAAANANHGVVSTAIRQLFEVDLGMIVLAFLAIAAGTHLCISYIATKQYAEGIRQNMNRFRWLTYAFGGTFAVLAVALLTGIYSFVTLLLIASTSVLMGFLGLASEQSQNDSVSQKRMYRLAVLAGIVPWATIGYTLFAAQIYGDAHVSAWVYMTYGLVTVFIGGILASAKLRAQVRGPWANAITSEQICILGTFVCNTALAWVIFAGALRS